MNIRNRRWAISGLVALAAAAAARAEPEAIQAAQALIHRVLPAHQSSFVCEIIPDDQGRDVFEFESNAGKIRLRGNNGVSLAMAFNWYLRYEAMTSYDWQATGPLTLSGDLPMPRGKVRRVCLARDRFFLNYCTYGYTFPFVDFAGWQRFLDWMAMNGVNRPLLQCGQEAVWLRVWQSYGLSETQILAYFTGPAHLPWHRMSNIDHFDGPLPRSYIDGQQELQKKLLKQARALGMQPVLSGFAGHVPEELKALRPDAKIAPIQPGWGRFGKEEACWFLDPLDPLFADIQRRFLQAQTALYGTDHRYAADPFNEISPPSWDPSYMASVGRGIYDSMARADPEAIWYQMGWAFYFDRKHWEQKAANGITPLRAILESVPRGRMVLLDYWCENVEYFLKTENFYGTDFLWDYLGNFGGNTHLNAPLQPVSGKIARALAVPNCRGVGGVLEGVDCNPVAHEMVLEQPWHPGGTIDVTSWVADYAARRTGRRDPRVAEAWTLMLKILPGNGGGGNGGHFALTSIPPAWNAPQGPLPPKTAPAGVVHGRPPEAIRGLVAALDALFQADPKSREADGYRYDAVNFMRQALAYYGDDVRARILDARKRNDPEDLARQARIMLGILRDMDELTGTRHEFLMGRWIRDARAWGATPAEADYYEANARRIVTAWGAGLRDYARREWNGLLRDYYLPRWWFWAQKYAPDAVKGETAPGPKDDFTAAKNAGYAVEPSGDPVGTAQRLFQKYRAEMIR